MTAEEIEMLNYKTKAEFVWNWFAGSSEAYFDGNYKKT